MMGEMLCNLAITTMKGISFCVCLVTKQSFNVACILFFFYSILPLLYVVATDNDINEGEITRLPYEFTCHVGGKLHQKNDVKGDYFCSSKHSQNCPFFPRRYWCGKLYTKNILLKMKHEYPTLDIASSSYVQKWISALKQRGSILFIGDSIHSHAAFTLMCLLRDNLEKEKLAFGNLFPYTKRISPLHGIVTRKNFCVKVRFASIYICYDRTNVAQNILDKFGKYSKLFQEFGTVVMNFGLHDKDLELSSVRTLLIKLKEVIDLETTLIWRETAPQHFNNKGGVYTPEKSKDSCIDISNHSLEQSNKFNLNYNSIFKEHRIPVLRIWNITKGYYTAHVQGECTHYCQPGIGELWIHELYTLLEYLHQ